jgi:hypothetical protein
VADHRELPALTREVLTEALKLAQTVGQPKHEAKDEAEAIAIVELAKRDPNLWYQRVQRRRPVI